VVHEADAGRALEGPRLDVLLRDLEAREIGVVLVFWCARVADAAALARDREGPEGNDADQT
jgi:hypothetical protein